MKVLIIQNNISQALEHLKAHQIKDYDKVIYTFCSEAKKQRREFHLQTYNFLKEKVSDIELVNFNELSQIQMTDGYFFGWNSFDEMLLIKELGLKQGAQNRLLDNYDSSTIKTFTPFRKKVEKNLPSKFSTNIYQATDTSLQNELNYFFYENHLAKEYFDIRNGIIGRDYSTKLSQYLSSGRLNARFFYNYIGEYEQEHGENKSTYWLKFELLWREYFYWSYQKHQQKFFSLHGIDGFEKYDRDIPDLEFEVLFEKDPFMRAVCNELIETGFVSNRLRQVFASSLINSYNIDWRIGAKFFEDHLIDYDVYSNWGNWQYLAGVGNDPRGLRVFNTIKQLRDYDPEFEYVKKWTKYSCEEEIIKLLIKFYS